MHALIIRLLFASACVLACAAPARAARILSDTWWNPAESGWSLVLEHRATISHAVLHVYDPDGRGRWYLAPLATTALTADGLPLLEGVIYATSGPPHGQDWNADQVSVEPAGEISIEPLSRRVLRLRYDLDGVEKDVVVERYSGIATPLAGAFISTAVLRLTGGGLPAATVVEQQVVEVDHHEDLPFGMVATGGTSPCNYMGDIETVGRTSEVFGTFSCADGASGTFLLDELVETPHGYTGQLRRKHGERTYLGNVSWLRP